MNIFAKSLMYNVNNDRTSKSYETLARQYVVYHGLLYNYYYLGFVKNMNQYINERFMIMYYNYRTYYNGSGYIVVYDFKASNGVFFVYADKEHYDFRFGRLRDGDNANEITCDYNQIEYIDNNFAEIDDTIENSGYEYVQYFDIINNADDETVYSQLNASLIKLSKIMNI